MRIQLRLLTLFFGISATVFASAQVVLLDQVAAVVDDDVVMASELNERVQNLYQRLEASGSEVPSIESIAPRVLEQLIIERIQLNMGKRAGVRISDAELNQSIQRLAAAQGMTIDQLVEKAHNSGVSLANLRRELRNEMIVTRVQESQVSRRIRITDQDVKNFLSSEEGQYWSSPDLRLGHILVALSPGANSEQVTEAQQKVAAIMQQLESGADFKNQAITQSSGQNALQGGDLGWRKATQLPPAFVTAVESLDSEQISQPIRSDAGFHILKLYEKRGAQKQLVLQHQVRHLLIKPSQIRTDEEAKAIATEIRKDIIAGSGFAELAKQHSEDIGSALSGGDLGWSLPGQFVPQFEEAMKAVEVGDVSEPFRSQFGWHILQVTERRNQDFSEDIKNRQAQNILFERKFQEELPLWLQQQREEAFVDIKI